MSTVLNKLLSLLAPRRREYLIVDREFKILELSFGVQQFADSPDEVILGKDIRLGFPELIGLEEILIEVLEERQESFELKGIGRSSAQDTPLYINFFVIKNKLGFEESEHQLIIFLEDVTEQMVLEQALVQTTNETSLLLSNLAAAKDYIDKIISAMADALVVTTSSGTIKTVNRATQDLFGYSETELIGKQLCLILNADSLSPAVSQQHLLGDTSFNNLEIVCQTKTGEKVTVAFSCSVIQTETDGVQNFIYIGRDITERQRTQKRIAVQYATTRILSESATVGHAIPKILEAIAQTWDWDLGEYWIPDETGDGEDGVANPQLRCVEMWVRPSIAIPEFVEMTQQTTLTAGVGIPGWIWATHSPQWIRDVVHDTNCERSQTAASAGLHGAFGVPVQDDNEILGVITFFSRDIQRLDRELLQVITTIGSQLGQFIKRKQAEAALRQEQEKSEQLLLNILPEPIAERLKQEQYIIAEDFPEVTVLFADIVGFTQLASSMRPIALLDLLNQIFSTFDRLCEQHNLEKIKTIGDAYMVVGGLPTPQANHAEAIAQMALDMQAAIAQFQDETGQAFSMRIGINTGPVVAGVIGLKKFSYDLWGDTVNIASRMESQGLPGQIQVTQATYEKLKEQFWFKERGTIEVKGKGLMPTFFLIGGKD